MNSSSNLSGYNIGSIPTPPWKTNNNMNIHSSSNFPGFTSTLPINPTSYEGSMRGYQDYHSRNNVLGGYGGYNEPKDNITYGAVSSQDFTNPRDNLNYNITSSSLHHNGGGGNNFGPVYGQRDAFYESEHLAAPKDNISHNNQPTKLTNFESSKGISDQGYRNEQNQIPAKQPPPVNPSPKDPSPKNPPKNRPTDQEDQELERKALAAEVTQDFYAKIKPLSLMQLAADVALKHARQEYYTKVKKPCPEKPAGSGHYTCDMCYVNFLTKEKLNMHNNAAQHRELEDLYSLKKEQARLIMEKKIKGPTPPKLEMKPLPEAEAETNLKATDLDLDVYILGIYESVMKPYWPVPNSQFYCRMCNYLEFNTEANLVHHNNTSEHMKREATYEEAFCLYCQRHYYNKQQLSTHVNTSKHEQIKDLMERTKEAATQRWHKLNAPPPTSGGGGGGGKDVREAAPKEPKEIVKTGSKRHSADDEKSPGKKQPIPSGKSSSDGPVKPSSKSSDSSSKGDTARKTSSQVADKKSSSSKFDPKKDSVSSSKSDAKTSSRPDSSRPDSSRPDSSRPDSSKPVSSSSSKGDERTSSSQRDTSYPKTSSSSSRDSMWFVPIRCSMCIVCHDLIKGDEEQRSHANSSKHLDNVKKFKSMI